jgi:hypothetical protein
MFNLPQSTPLTRTSKSRTLVLYRAHDGKIMHIHHSVEFEGPGTSGGRTSTETAEERLRRLTKVSDDQAYHVIEVQASDLPRAAARVDHATKAIISE